VERRGGGGYNQSWKVQYGQREATFTLDLNHQDSNWRLVHAANMNSTQFWTEQSRSENTENSDSAELSPLHLKGLPAVPPLFLGDFNFCLPQIAFHYDK
jgi:hypothetical protein